MLLTNIQARCASRKANVKQCHPTRNARAHFTNSVPPSSVTAASELEVLRQLSTVVPDTFLDGSQVAAATVSHGVLASVLKAQKLGQTPVKNAIVNALSYDRCASLQGNARLACCTDKAIANVGALFNGLVDASGRVATTVDPTLANDTGALVSKVQALAALYADMGVPLARLVWRLPATWAATQAARTLESKGYDTQVYYVFSLAQAAAAMQAGASVLQVNVGAVRDWFERHPGAIRDPKGPREDATGAGGASDPGLRLVREVYAYASKYHPSTRLMASGLRSREDALACAGAAFLLLPKSVVAALSATPTAQGYNDGVSADSQLVGSDAGVAQALSPAMATALELDELSRFSESSFAAALHDSPAGQDLLARGLASGVQDVVELTDLLKALSVGLD